MATTPTLPITNSSDGQTSTQNPQAASAANSAAAQTSAVQPTSTSGLVSNSQGVALHSTDLPGVPLTNTSTAQPVAAVPARHIHPGLIGISVFLFIIAIVLFWWTGRSAKNTTD